MRHARPRMFTESEFSRKTIGDVDVIWHDGLYHLFHLVLPNHDFIAHAISDNGLNWRRVDNALFIGDPGSWDDLMLWTMAVSAARTMATTFKRAPYTDRSAPRRARARARARASFGPGAPAGIATRLQVRPA